VPLHTEQWLTADEVAAHLKIHVDTVRGFSRAGLLPASKLRGRWLRFRMEDVAEFETATRAAVVEGQKAAAETAKARASLAPAIGEATSVAVTPDTPVGRHDIILG
jgi:excisionase family DNA binding protein